MLKLLHIYTIENPKEETVLRKKSKELSKEEILSNEFQSFLDDFLYTAKEVVTEEGYCAAGLAAIQVGKDIKVFCILKEDSGEFEIMINPKVKGIGTAQVLGTEGCLSVPNREGSVLRNKKVKVKFMDRNGVVRRGVFSNQEAREIQHEYDHTEGVLFIDKLHD